MDTEKRDFDREAGVRDENPTRVKLAGGREPRDGRRRPRLRL